MAGPHDWDWASPTTATPAPSPVNTVNPNFGGTGGANQPSQVTAPPVQNQVSPGHPGGGYNPNLNPPTTVDITEDITEDIGGGHFGLSLHGDQPYEPPPVVPEITDLRIMETLADIHGQNPKYKKSWDFNPDNPDNLLRMVDEYGAPTHTLRSLIATSIDPETGKPIPILDSSGNVIYTSFGKHMKDQYQADPEGFYNEMVDNMTWEDMAATESDFWRGYTAPGGEGGYQDYGDQDYYGDRRDAKMDLLTALQSGAPSREMEQSGFFDTLVDPYAEAQSKALESGIFSGLMPGYTGEGMKRLLRSYGSGLQAPRYANVAKGGIVGLLGV